MSTMTLRLDDDLKQRLDRLTKATRRTRSALAAEAIREFVDLNEWQIGEIAEAIAEADCEAFAGGNEVARVLGKWGAGRKSAVLLPIAEYEALLADLADLVAIAERRSEPTEPFSAVKARLEAKWRK